LKELFNSKEFEEKYHYDKSDLGAVYLREKTMFKVWSPLASNVNLLLYKTGEGGQYIEKIPMFKEEKGIWRIDVEKDLKNIYYTYEVTVNHSTNEAVDPYARAVGVNGNRAMVVDLFQTNPPGFENDKRVELRNPTDAILYELHVRDISICDNSGVSNKGEFLGLTETGTRSPQGEKTGLDHIKELGVTHVHLLPSFDYCSVDEGKLNERQYNWGYDPQNYNVPEGSYSTNPFDGAVRIKEFKQMVKTFHDNGIGVILDVVYNHTGLTEDSLFNKIVPGYYYRQNSEGGFSDGAACFNETASDRSMFRKYMIDSVVYWAKEYHLDGFRFDLMGLHDIDTMNEIRKELDKIDSNILMYGEGWTAADTPLIEEKRAIKKNVPKFNERIAAFNDDIRDAVKGHVFYKEEAGFVNGKEGMEESVKFGIVAATSHAKIDYSKVIYSKEPWAKEPTQTVNYVSAHDNFTLWDKLAETNPEDSEELRIKMDILSNFIVLTSQGIPFIHAGEEFLRTKFGDENSFKSPDNVNQLDWEKKSKNREVFEYYKGLIELRKTHPAFRMTNTKDIQNHLSFIDIPRERMIGYIISNNANGDSWGNILVILNGNRETQEVTLPSEEWSIVVNDKVAGIKVIEKITDGKASVPAIGALVLYSN